MRSIPGTDMVGFLTWRSQSVAWRMSVYSYATALEISGYDGPIGCWDGSTKD